VRLLEHAGFVDAYRARPDLNTCNPNRRAKRIDYLFHTPSLRSRPRDLPAITDRTPLPSEQQPSDHLAVGASFEWTPGWPSQQPRPGRNT
jgi:hypothetical protein